MINKSLVSLAALACMMLPLVLTAQDAKVKVAKGRVLAGGEAVPVYPGVTEVEVQHEGIKHVFYQIPVKSVSQGKALESKIVRFYQGKTVFGVKAAPFKKPEEGQGWGWELRSCKENEKNLTMFIYKMRDKLAVEVKIMNSCNLQ